MTVRQWLHAHRRYLPAVWRHLAEPVSLGPDPLWELSNVHLRTLGRASGGRVGGRPGHRSPPSGSSPPSGRPCPRRTGARAVTTPATGATTSTERLEPLRHARLDLDHHCREPSDTPAGVTVTVPTTLPEGVRPTSPGSGTAPGFGGPPYPRSALRPRSHLRVPVRVGHPPAAQCDHLSFPRTRDRPLHDLGRAVARRRLAGGRAGA